MVLRGADCDRRRDPRRGVAALRRVRAPDGRGRPGPGAARAAGRPASAEPAAPDAAGQRPEGSARGGRGAAPWRGTGRRTARRVPDSNRARQTADRRARCSSARPDDRCRPACSRTWRWYWYSRSTIALCAASASAQPISREPAGPPAAEKPAILREVGIDQRLDERVPLDLPFRDEHGRQVRLGEYFGTRPVVLALVYYECPMLCTQVLNGLVSALGVLSLDVGREFDVVAVSFDPAEGPGLAMAKKRVVPRTLRASRDRRGLALSDRRAGIDRAADESRRVSLRVRPGTGPVRARRRDHDPHAVGGHLPVLLRHRVRPARRAARHRGSVREPRGIHRRPDSAALLSLRPVDRPLRLRRADAGPDRRDSDGRGIRVVSLVRTKRQRSPAEAGRYSETWRRRSSDPARTM